MKFDLSFWLIVAWAWTGWLLVILEARTVKRLEETLSRLEMELRPKPSPWIKASMIAMEEKASHDD